MSSRFSPAQAEMMRWPVLTPEARNTMSPVALNRPVCVIGARVRVHLPLASAEISKAHALLVQDAGGVYLRDLASRNHSFLNGSPISETLLEPGNSIRFGPFTFRCQSGFDNSNPAEIPPAELRIRPEGSSFRQTQPIERYTFLIGSRQGCDLILPGADIALAHAILFARNGRRYLRDLSSGTGTFVNEQPIREVELKEGDEIRVGRSRIEYIAAKIAEPEIQLSVAEEEQLQLVDEEPAAAKIPMHEPVEESEMPTHSDVDQFSLPWENEEVHVELDADEVVTHRPRLAQRA